MTAIPSPHTLSPLPHPPARPAPAERAPRREDAALVARMAAGDQGALAALYDRHAPLLLGLLVRMLGRRCRAEETLQEVFLQAWTEAPRYRPDRASPRTWLVLLARSRALDRIRSTTARRRREIAVEDRRSRRTEPPVGTTRLEQATRRFRVRAALARIPAAQRDAIRLAFYEGLTHTEISARLGLPLGTVKSRLLLGMRKLRGLLEPPAAPRGR